MKAILLALVLTFSSSIFADTKIDARTCNKLNGVFSRQSIVGLLKVKNIDNDRTVEYLDNVNVNLNKEIEIYCEKNQVTIESLIQKYAKTCSTRCHEDDKDLNLKKKPGLLDSDKLFSESDKAFKACETLCAQAQEKLDTFKMGADIAAKPQSKASPDCSGVVSDKGRGMEIKAVEFDLDKRTRTTILKTSGK